MKNSLHSAEVYQGDASVTKKSNIETNNVTADVESQQRSVVATPAQLNNILNMNIDLFKSFYSPSMEGQIILIHGEWDLIKSLGTQFLFQSACNNKECICSYVDWSSNPFSGINQTSWYDEINAQINLGGFNIHLTQKNLEFALVDTFANVIENQKDAYIFSIGGSLCLQQNELLEKVRTYINRIGKKTMTPFIFRRRDDFSSFEAEYEFEIKENNGTISLMSLKYGGHPFPDPLYLKFDKTNGICPFEVI